MKLGCIGYGNMATAILAGLLKSGSMLPSDVVVFDPGPQKMEICEKTGMQPAASEADVLQRCESILLAVKPNVLPDVLRSFSGFSVKEKIFISIAAGITVEKMENILGQGTPIVRAMPNTPLLVGMGTTALCHSTAVTEQMFSFARKLFSCSGTVYDIPESEFNDVINLNGSSPAFIYLFANTIAEYTASTSNITKDVALKMVCDTLKGSAEMMDVSGYSPEELIQMVSSPNGTTVAALRTFKETGFEESLRAGLTACVKRAVEMGKE